jgi:preprotein translocase subunit SecG
VNPWLAAGQILVSVALMASILLQARGAGLSAAFGGDSSVYRSRRGIEKRLFQFTILLTVLFVIFSVATYLLSRSAAS